MALNGTDTDLSVTFPFKSLVLGCMYLDVNARLDLFQRNILYL